MIGQCCFVGVQQHPRSRGPKFLASTKDGEMGHRGMTPVPVGPGYSTEEILEELDESGTSEKRCVGG